MGCGCNKGRQAGRRPAITPRAITSTSSGQAAGPAPIQLRAASLQQEKSPGGLSKERRLAERKRRAAIARRVLGR